MKTLKILTIVMFLAVCVVSAGCKKKEEEPYEEPHDMPVAQKPASKQPAPEPPKPAATKPVPAKPATPATREMVPAPPKQAFTWGIPFQEKDAEGRKQMCVNITNNLAARLKVKVTFVFTRDQEGKDVIQQLLLPRPVELEANKQTKVGIPLDKVDPVGSYWCVAKVEVIE